MTDGVGELSGPGNQQVYLNVYRVGQDQAGNYSQFYAYIEYRGNGYGSYGINASWSVVVAGQSVGGSFVVSYAQRNDNIGLWGGYFHVGHDAAGNLGAFNSQGSISTDHGSVGSGSVTVTEAASPRIPKRPSPPGIPTFSEITPTSVRVSWAASSDNAGSVIDAYLLRSWPGTPSNPSSTGGYTDHSQENNRSRVVTGLTPGVTRTFAVYAHNGSAQSDGYSSVGPHAALGTPAGVYVSDGTNWIPTGLNVSDGENWVNQLPAVSTGSAWVNPT